MDLSQGYPMRNAGLPPPPPKNPGWYDNNSYQLVQLECDSSKFDTPSGPYQSVPVSQPMMSSPHYRGMESKQSLIRSLLASPSMNGGQPHMPQMTMPEEALRSLCHPGQPMPPQVSPQNRPSVVMPSKMPVITNVMGNGTLKPHQHLAEKIGANQEQRTHTKMRTWNFINCNQDFIARNKNPNASVTGKSENKFNYELVSQIITKDNAIKTLTRKVAEQDVNIKNAIRELESVSKERTDAKEEVLKATKRLKSKDVKLKSIEEKMIETEKEKDEAVKGMEALANILKQRDLELSRCEGNLQELRRKVTDLEQAYREVDLERREVAQKLEGLESELEGKEMSLKAFKEKLCRAQRQVRIMEKEKNDTDRIHHESLQNTQVLKAVMNQKDCRIEQLQRSLREKSEEITRKNEKLQHEHRHAVSKRIRELERLLKEKEKREDELKARLLDEEKKKSAAEKSKNDITKQMMAAWETEAKLRSEIDKAKESREHAIEKEKESREHAEQLIRTSWASEQRVQQNEILQRRVAQLERCVTEAAYHMEGLLKRQQSKNNGGLSCVYRELRAIGCSNNAISENTVAKRVCMEDDEESDLPLEMQNPPTPDISDYEEHTHVYVSRTKPSRNKRPTPRTPEKTQEKKTTPVRTVKKDDGKKVRKEGKRNQRRSKPQRKLVIMDSSDEDGDDNIQEEVDQAGEINGEENTENEKQEEEAEVICLSSGDSDSDEAEDDQTSLDIKLEKLGGLWCSTQEVLKNLKGLKESDKRRAFLIQIEYRCVVLDLDRFKKVHSTFGMPEDIEKMKDYLIKMIEKVEREETQRKKEIEESAIKNEISSSEDEGSEEEEENLDHLKRERKRWSSSSSINAPPKRPKRQKKQRGTKRSVSFENLSGKLIEHYVVDNDGNKDWYRGVIIELARSHVIMKYEFDNEKSRRLTTKEVKRDFEEGDLVVLEVTQHDFIGKVIENLWVMEEGRMEWSKGHVIRIETEKGDESEFEVLYGEGGDDGSYFYYVPLLKDYWNNEVKVLTIEQRDLQ